MRSLRSVVVSLALAAALVTPAAALAQSSARVEHLGTLPVAAGIGANFKDGYMFVTGTSGLYVYDVREAASPKPVVVLPLPHYENEDVSIGGNRLLISGDGSVGGGVVTVVNIANPALPVPERVIKLDELPLLSAGHTATCIQDCRYAWVAGNGSITVLDLDAAAPQVGSLDAPPEFGWSTHDVQVDEAGFAWVVGGDGTVAYDVRPGSYPVAGAIGPAALLEPKLVARTGSAALNDGDFFDGIPTGDPDNSADTVNDFIHHNSWRPDAAALNPQSNRSTQDSTVRPGELVLITEEDIWNRPSQGTAPGGCETQGSFQTWRLSGLGSPAEGESTLRNLDSWTTEFNEAIANDEDPWGRDILPTKGFCSSHYFDERDGLVATAWYEQGTRLLDVSDPRDIRQVGYFMPEATTAWATYWAPTASDVLYVVDNKRGVDVLRVDRESAKAGGRVRAPMPSRPSDDAVPHPRFGFVCRLPGL